MKTMTLSSGKVVQAERFKNADVAARWAAGSGPRMWVVAGHGAFFVVKPRDAAHMFATGEFTAV